MRTDFHPLTVTRVDKLTDDAAAVTLAVRASVQGCGPSGT